MDRQRCPLKIGSCMVLPSLPISDVLFPVAYTSTDLTYQWTAGRGVNIASDMKLSQFDLISTPTGNETMVINHGNIGRNSPPKVDSRMCRRPLNSASKLPLTTPHGRFCHSGEVFQLGAAALVCPVQVYGPCILLVVISWVSFWLNREATSDRISLGTEIQQVQYLFYTINQVSQRSSQ